MNILYPNENLTVNECFELVATKSVKVASCDNKASRVAISDTVILPRILNAHFSMFIAAGPPNTQGYPPQQPGYPPQQQHGYPPPQQQGAPHVVVHQQQPATQVIVVGNCPTCHAGVITDSYTACGIILAICLFPIGVICCLMMKERRCSNCNATF